ncbi:hypothetical protein HDU98_000443 [Podochytrium sp. JEL0797]|nr:hypothetical protein HDU98_000443 [Podochytrium sp. JEL0797]
MNMASYSDSAQTTATEATCAENVPADATNNPSLATIHSLLLAMDRRLARLEASTTTLSTTADETKSHLLLVERSLSRQIVKLQNTHAKFYTRFQDLPLELVTRIFAHVYTDSVFKFSRLSKGVRACLATKHFAVLNLNLARAKRTLLPLPHQLMQWAKWPHHFQQVFAETDGKQLELLVVENRRFPVGAKIPTNLACFKTLKRLSLRNNQFVGPIGEEIGGLVSLTSLDLSHNLLTDVDLVFRLIVS